MPINKQAIFDTHDCGLVSVEVPEWNATLYVKSFSVGDVFNFEKNQKDGKNAAVSLIILAVCDEDGSLVFDDTDYDALMKKSKTPIEKLMTEILKINRLDDNSVEDERKN